MNMFHPLFLRTSEDDDSGDEADASNPRIRRPATHNRSMVAGSDDDDDANADGDDGDHDAGTVKGGGDAGGMSVASQPAGSQTTDLNIVIEMNWNIAEYLPENTCQTLFRDIIGLYCVEAVKLKKIEISRQAIAT